MLGVGLGRGGMRTVALSIYSNEQTLLTYASTHGTPSSSLEHLYQLETNKVKPTSFSVNEQVDNHLKQVRKIQKVVKIR